LDDFRIGRHRGVEDLRRVEIPMLEWLEFREARRAVRDEDRAIGIEVELSEEVARDGAEHVRAAEYAGHGLGARAVEETVVVASALQKTESACRIGIGVAVREEVS